MQIKFDLQVLFLKCATSVNHRKGDVQIGGEQNPDEIGHHEARGQGGDLFKPDDAGNDCRVQKQNDDGCQPEGAAAKKEDTPQKVKEQLNDKEPQGRAFKLVVCVGP